MPRLERAAYSRKPALRRLLTDYLVELAALTGSVLHRGTGGHVSSYCYFDRYWTEPQLIPFGIWCGDALAGFCLLRDTGTHWQVAELFVVPAFRRQGVGAAAVDAVKRFGRVQRGYACLEARTLHENTRALAFWRSQGFETVCSDAEGLSNVFRLDLQTNGRADDAHAAIGE